MWAVWPLIVITALSSTVAEQLAFLDPVRVGHSRLINLGDGHQVEVRTMAMRPPLFYVSGFMSPTEADDLVMEAKAGKRLTSLAQGSEPSLGVATFRAFDRNRNGELDESELKRLMNMVFLVANHDHELFMSYHSLLMPTITEEVFRRIDFSKYRDWIVQNHPQSMQRFSDQVWLKYNRTDTQRLVRRAGEITGLPEVVVSGESAMQVLHYGKLGHYSCHWDTPPDQCPKGPIMRLGTMVLFLNEPQAGGQIAFPAADKVGSENYNVSDWASVKQQCQVTNPCTTMGGVVVPPKKGDAVFWYNLQTNHWRDDGEGHFLHEGKDSFLWNSLHCAAEVQAGEKWIANMWFRAPNSQPSTSSTIAAPSTVHI
jgi:hypothetical protein